METKPPEPQRVWDDSPDIVAVCVWIGLGVAVGILIIAAVFMEAT